ncbi:MAG TPA: type II toxin-antitoxin system prevent-host-death family antitoxin [Cyclobacteriaceae bacterium]|jgi:antitoxin (DNA-binding transcriptional repressor) of toxin-antitoxin stability system|nr:type II toxin-antitoxin system prevent-host-death family antitoxin [Cytophagales bacterium]HMR57790.1 type II toxin-antitoxin system prevent-host-death family antitoxin [Cyclobacteriaceae bacterium]HRE67513.1 type II toxin-antitoxin system prevent-host-death family antitoxin [Cyclobacteriaceae bacterium]HRF33380.1 type II toxin-antitoxin system prevent-host-death family antitoxin [Cyclobacteriaceae bacterium]
METVNIHKAKSTLSSLIKRVLKGEKIIIASRGTPLVTLNKIENKKGKRVGGQFKGKVWIADDFDELPKEFMKHFE